ncbi:ORF6N domain-containing protein [candidate division WOR-3 bacterium]|nr:ORF6N domain-containing protein [candidate division WOR-3 bacterium]
MPIERIEKRILVIRNQKVILDKDLAALYGVSTKRLNEQVKRNMKRFPEDFMFQLTRKEKQRVVAKCDHLHVLKYSPALPYAFTEHGAVMLASVLNSPIAVQTSILVVRAFIKLREALATHKDIMHKIDELEKKYDEQFRVVFEAIRQLMEPPVPRKRKIGFSKD